MPPPGFAPGGHLAPTCHAGAALFYARVPVDVSTVRGWPASCPWEMPFPPGRTRLPSRVGVAQGEHAAAQRYCQVFLTSNSRPQPAGVRVVELLQVGNQEGGPLRGHPRLPARAPGPRCAAGGTPRAQCGVCACRDSRSRLTTCGDSPNYAPKTGEARGRVRQTPQRAPSRWGEFTDSPP